MAQTGKVFGHYILAWSESCIVCQSTLEIQEIPGVTLHVHDTKQSKQLYCIQTEGLSFKNSLLLSSPHFILLTITQNRPFPVKSAHHLLVPMEIFCLHEQLLLHFTQAVSGYTATIKLMLLSMTKRKISCASLSSCWSEGYENWDLKQGAHMDLDLPLVSQSCCTNCHVYATFTN